MLSGNEKIVLTSMHAVLVIAYATYLGVMFGMDHQNTKIPLTIGIQKWYKTDALLQPCDKPCRDEYTVKSIMEPSLLYLLTATAIFALVSLVVRIMATWSEYLHELFNADDTADMAPLERFFVFSMFLIEKGALDGLIIFILFLVSGETNFLVLCLGFVIQVYITYSSHHITNSDDESLRGYLLATSVGLTLVLWVFILMAWGYSTTQEDTYYPMINHFAIYVPFVFTLGSWVYLYFSRNSKVTDEVVLTFMYGIVRIVPLYLVWALYIKDTNLVVFAPNVQH